MTLRKQIIIGAATILCVALPSNAIASHRDTTNDQTNDRRHGPKSDDDSQINGNEDIKSDAQELDEMDETHPYNDDSKVNGSK